MGDVDGLGARRRRPVDAAVAAGAAPVIEDADVTLGALLESMAGGAPAAVRAVLRARGWADAEEARAPEALTA